METGLIDKLIAEINGMDGSVVKKNPRILGGNSTAVVRITLDRKACMEIDRNYEFYSRIQLIDNFVVGFGKICELVE